MAVNAYLIIDGVEGPSTSKKKAIDILSFSFGVSQTSTFGTGASGKEAHAGRADFGQLNIMKVLDKTSPAILDNCVVGKVFKKVELFYDKPTGAKKDSQQDYFRITLQDALVSSIQLSGSADNPVESVSFTYRRIEVAYKPEKDDGTLDNYVPKGYDLATLQPWAA